MENKGIEKQLELYLHNSSVSLHHALCTELVPTVFIRESSLEPDTRPASGASIQSGSAKRKTSPKFHFLKNRRKCLLPSKFEEHKQDETVQDDDAKSIHDDETEAARERRVSARSNEGELEGPVDFTIKNEQLCSSPELGHDKEVPDIPADMAAFLANASAAVRNVGHFQVNSPS